MMYPVSKVLANQLYEINQIKDNRLYPNKIVGLFCKQPYSVTSYCLHKMNSFSVKKAQK